MAVLSSLAEAGHRTFCDPKRETGPGRGGPGLLFGAWFWRTGAEASPEACFAFESAPGGARDCFVGLVPAEPCATPGCLGWGESGSLERGVMAQKQRLSVISRYLDSCFRDWLALVVFWLSLFEPATCGQESHDKLRGQQQTTVDRLTVNARPPCSDRCCVDWLCVWWVRGEMRGEAGLRRPGTFAIGMSSNEDT